jgi:hypothetical protein
MNELTTYPKPPAHYKTFSSGPTALQPPDISNLGPTYRMFGQVVQNPTFPENAKIPPPPIDKDMMMYDPKNGLKNEIVRLVDTLPSSVAQLLRSIQNRPNTANKDLRDLDNRVKSLFHALEQLRPVEAKKVLKEMTQDEIKIRENARTRCEELVRLIDGAISETG